MPSSTEENNDMTWNGGILDLFTYYKKQVILFAVFYYMTFYSPNDLDRVGPICYGLSLACIWFINYRKNPSDPAVRRNVFHTLWGTLACLLFIGMYVAFRMLMLMIQALLI